LAKKPQPDQLTDTPKPRKTFRKLMLRGTALGTAVGLYFGAPYIDMATDSYTLPPMADCSPHNSAIVQQETPPSEMRDAAMQAVLDAPESVGALTIQAILSKGGSSGRMNAMLRDGLGIPVTYDKADESKAYKQSCEFRGDLLDVSIFNPLLLDGMTQADMENQDNYIQFHALMNYYDEASANKAVAYYQPDTGTLLISTLGLTHNENNDRAIAAISENTDRLVPYEFAEKFIGELRDQIRAQGLKVNNTSIMSHSLGTAGGVLMKGMLEKFMANQMVFGKKPSLTIVEGFGESLAADAVTAHLDLPREKLTRNTISMRSGDENDANIIAAEWDSNRTIGEKVYAISFPEGQESHRMEDIVRGVVKGERKITRFEGRFHTDGADRLKGEGGQFLGKLAREGRELRQTLGLD
jgi:hypothetical protein